MRGLAPCLDLQPEIALVRRNQLQPGRLTHNRKVSLEAAFDQRPGSTLTVLFIDQSSKDDLGIRRSPSCSRDFHQCGQHRGDAALRVTCAATVQAPAFPLRCERLPGGDTHRIHVGRENDTVPGPIRRSEAKEHVGSTGKHSLELHVEASPGRGRGQEISHT